MTTATATATTTKGDEEGEEEDCFFNPGLFSNTTLERVSYRVGGIEQTVLASTASSTDHDQTGEIIWPISVFLASFVAAHGERFYGHQVMELGAGCAGLPGLVAARFAEGVLLTDGNDAVLGTLKRNVNETNSGEAGTSHVEKGENGSSTTGSRSSTSTSTGTTSSGSSKRLEARSLMWGEKESVQAVLDDGWRPQILLGADIVCWIDFVAPLLQTVKFFFQHSPDPLQAVLYLGFVNRANATERLLYSEAQAMGMRVTRVPAETFLPLEKEDWPAELQTQQKLELLTLSLDPTLEGYNRPVCMDSSKLIGRATPC